MKVPLSWLREYVEVDFTPEELARRLTFSGVEVEGVERIGGTYEGIVAGEILEILPHPGADRLRLCRVSNGQGTVEVVCGAPGISVGDKAPLAQVGAKLPNGTVIERSKIRGQWSDGMLCAEDELGISGDHTGLMRLPAETRPGMPLSSILGPPDVVLDLEITWNRGDCLSIIGMAREVAALFGGRLKLPSVEFPEQDPAVETFASVRVEDPDGCPRYTARVMTGVCQGPSPEWMQRRLTMCGVRAISNVVDITNYVMLECGHPLHAFDYELLRGHRIEVRRARAGEKIRTLDGLDRELTPQMLVIADAERPVAVAGIMGGEGSEIRDVTRTVLLEAATFSPVLTHATCRGLGMGTESSSRYERYVDAAGVEWASRRAAALMAQCAGARVARGVVDVYGRVPVARRIRCRHATLQSLLGVAVPLERVASILESLQVRIVARDAESVTAEAPTFRPDLEIEADLIEEVARIHGLENIPAAVPAARVVPGMDDARTRAQQACRSLLNGMGISEIMNYSFLAVSTLDRYDTTDRESRMMLPNPVSADYAVMRNSLLPQMVESLGRNFSRQVWDARFFEMGRVFLRDPATKALREEDRLAIGLMGKAVREGVRGKKTVPDAEMFLCLKGTVLALCAARGVGPVTLVPSARPFYQAGWCATIVIGSTPVGLLGLLDAAIRRNWKVTEPVGVAELLMEPLLAPQQVRRTIQPIPVYPSVSRDVALILEEAVTHEAVISAIRREAPKELIAVELFDIFRSDGIGAGRKSMAYTLVYRSGERTLTDEDANGYHNAIKDRLKKELKAEIRES